MFFLAVLADAGMQKLAPAILELEWMIQQTNNAALNVPASCLVDIGDEALLSISRLLTNSHGSPGY